jgi:hypothetical protein
MARARQLIFARRRASWRCRERRNRKEEIVGARFDFESYLAQNPLTNDPAFTDAPPTLGGATTTDGNAPTHAGGIL